MKNPQHENKVPRDFDKSDERPRAISKEDPPVEQEPAVERGERIATGKAIARGGKSHGKVAGATPMTRPTHRSSKELSEED